MEIFKLVQVSQLSLLQLFVAKLGDAHFQYRFSLLDHTRYSLVPRDTDQSWRHADLKNGGLWHVVKVKIYMLHQLVLVDIFD